MTKTYVCMLLNDHIYKRTINYIYGSNELLSHNLFINLPSVKNVINHKTIDSLLDLFHTKNGYNKFTLAHNISFLFQLLNIILLQKSIRLFKSRRVSEVSSFSHASAGAIVVAANVV